MNARRRRTLLSVLFGFILLGSPWLLFSAQAHSPHRCLLTPEQLEILSHMSIVHLGYQNEPPRKTIRIEGVNVQIINGEDVTETTNGVGNLIVGYSFPSTVERGDQITCGGEGRSGSHNLVLGDADTWRSYGGIIAGFQNHSEAPYASAIGGSCHRALGEGSVALGGFNGQASGIGAVTVGGAINGASGSFSLAAGGQLNGAGGEASVVLGGGGNDAFTLGDGNGAIGDRSVVVGGKENRADAKLSTIVGGWKHSAEGALSTIAGGCTNRTIATQTTVAGGSRVLGNTTCGIHVGQCQPCQ